MRRSPDDCLRDVLDATTAIARYTAKGRQAFESDPMQRDAVIARLMQIGQAVKDTQAGGVDLRRLQPDIRWADVARMRDKLAHRYWVTDVEIVWQVVEIELPKLATAVNELLARGLSAIGARKPRKRKPRA